MSNLSLPVNDGVEEELHDVCSVLRYAEVGTTPELLPVSQPRRGAGEEGLALSDIFSLQALVILSSKLVHSARELGVILQVDFLKHLQSIFSVSSILHCHLQGAALHVKLMKLKNGGRCLVREKNFESSDVD